MRKIGLTALAVLALALASCGKPVAQQEPPAPTSEPALNTPTPTPVPPAPVAVATPPPAPEPSREVAPEGVFYLLTAARIETADGVHGLPPGTGVKKIREGVYLTPQGEAAIDATILTNDMAKARTARDADRAAQYAIRQQGATEAATVAAAQPPAGLQSPSSHLSRNAQTAELDRQQAMIRLQMDRLSAERRALPNRDSKTSPRALAIKQQTQRLEEQLRQIREQRVLLQY